MHPPVAGRPPANARVSATGTVTHRSTPPITALVIPTTVAAGPVMGGSSPAGGSAPSTPGASTQPAPGIDAPHPGAGTARARRRDVRRDRVRPTSPLDGRPHPLDALREDPA